MQVARDHMEVLGLLLPNRCAVCRRLGLCVCDACDALLVAIGRTGCARCGAPGPWPVERCSECAGRRLAFSTARAAIAYDDRARTLVHGWKEGGQRDLAAWAAGRIVASLPRPPVDALATVPGDRDRTLSRGHVTSLSLARQLSKAWDLPVSRLLSRPGHSSRQRGLGRVERRRNVRDAFRAGGSAPQRVCLVDDVYTTGSTADACARALRRSGTREVHVITLARVVL